MAKKLEHQTLYDYDTIKNISKKYQKPVMHIAAIMQKKDISSLGLFFDDIYHFDSCTKENTVSPTEHTKIPFEKWRNYQFNPKEGFLYGLINILKTDPAQDVRSGYRDIYIHKEEFRRKSGLIKTTRRIHPHIVILEKIYFEMRKGKKSIKPSEFIDHIESYSGIGTCKAISSISGKNDRDIVVILLPKNKIENITIGAIKDRVTIFNRKYKTLTKKP